MKPMRSVSQRGLTLVELMVAIALNLAIVAIEAGAGRQGCPTC